MLINRQDLLYAIRSARRAPLLTLIVVVALSVGIGLNAGVFTILNYLFLQSPTKKDVSSFVQAYPRYEGWLTSAGQFSSFTTEDYDAIRTQSLTLSEVAASEPTGAMLDDAHKRSPALLVTCNYFRVYGIERPLMGRFFRADECKPGTTERIVVLSEHVWKNHFAANPQIIGKVIHLNREPFIVVGIASDNSANFISGGLWVPYTLQPVFDHGSNLIQNPDTPWLTVVGRLKQGYFRVDAKSELETILHQQDRLYLQRNITTLDRKTSLTLTNGSFIRSPAVQSMVMMLMALIMGPLSLVLMLACTNVTMLFLSRSVVRRGEIAIRLALGGGRARLVRMLVIESFLTAALSGVISVYLAYRVPILIFGVIAPSEAKFAGLIQPNWMVFSFLALLVLIATVVSALAPMRESLKLDLVTALKGRDGAATMRSRTTNAMIIAQLAMSFVLMTAAVLFARLPAMVTGIDPGFETRQTMTVPLDVETPPYTKTSGLAFYRTLSVFDQFDGVQPGWAPFNGTTRTQDGRLWFANGHLLQMIDPAHLVKNNVRPPVQIEDVVADTKSYAPQTSLNLPPRMRNLEIDYTALSFVVPQKVRFRYKLEGHDSEWQNPGTRRQAFYDDLHPGHYKFRVIASNNDGLWNQDGATLDFYVAPAWYQTNWFRTSCVVAFMFLLWALYRVRLQQLTRQFNRELEARIDERTRIARDLHDTLLQSFHGLMLSFQAASNLFATRPTEAKRTLDNAIDEAAEAITEGRDAIQSLRSSPVDTNDIVSAITALGDELAASGTSDNSVAFCIDLAGTPRNLRSAVRDEIYWIACEALRNAFQHARANRITVEIQYDNRQFSLHVRDDGKGFDPTALGEAARTGHFGLHGMSERARLVGGQLDLWSDVDSGAEVELSIPASFAYTQSPASLRSWWSRMFSRKGTAIK